MKTVIEISLETLNKIERGLSQIGEIKETLEDIGSIKLQERYTAQEFMEKAKISRNKYEQIKSQLNPVKVSARKTLHPHSDLVRWFNGEIQ